MPIFDNEIKDKGTKLSNIELPDVDKRSPTPTQINPNLGMEDLFGSNQTPTYNGVKWGEMTNIGEQRGFDRPFSGVTKATLLENQRYPMYQKDVDLENINALNQPWYKQLGNGLAKMGISAVGTFAQTTMTLPDTADAVATGRLSSLSGGTTGGVEATTGDWMKKMEDIFPNYVSTYEREHPFKSILGSGFANFLGDKIFKNIGVIGGFVAGAAAQDAAIGFVTEGLGEIPGLANQIGKASLAINKFISGTNDVEKTLSALSKEAEVAGRVLTDEQILNVRKLGQLSEASKLNTGLKYTLAQYGSARTMGAVDARDTYNEVNKKLIEQYKSTHGGDDPVGKDLDEINDYSTNAMNTRFGIDMVLLSVSNSIQFDNLFKSFGKASKSVTSGLTQDFEGLGKIGLKEKSLDEFEMKGATSIPGKAWESIRPKLPNIFSESVITMGGMYSGSKGVEDYYTNKYKDLNNPKNKDSFDSLNQVLKSTQYALGQQFGTTEGLDSMFTGAMLGLVTSAIHSGIDRSRGMSKEQRLQEAINIVNEHKVTSILGDRYNDTLNSVNNAKEMQDAAKTNNIFKYKNLQHDEFFNLVNSRLNAGMHDYTIEQLKMLKDLPKEEFEKYFGVDFTDSNKTTVGEYVNTLIDHANELKKTYDAISGTFKNPYERFVKADTEEKKKSNQDFNNFEKWKTNLTYYSSISGDVNSRITSIQKNLYNIHPDLNNNLVASLVNPDSLKNIAQSYEERAKALNGTITDDMTASEKQAIKDEVKTLRTNSEKINLALSNKNLDAKTFHDILNFELNNQDGTKDNVVGFEHAHDLYEYGNDLNKLAIQKKKASLAVDALTSSEGFEKFFDLAEKMNSDMRFNPKDFKQTSTEPTPPPAGGLNETPEGPKFTNKEGNIESFEVGRQYSTEKFNEPKITKIDEDRWQVSIPNGATTFHKSKEKAQAKVNEIKQDYADLATVKIIGFNEDGTIKVEDINGDIQNIPAEAFGGYEKVESRQEKLIKYAAEVGKIQDELEKNSGDIATGSDEEDIKTMIQQSSFEDRKKDAPILFLSTKTESEDWSDTSKSSPHIVRSREFLNNASNLPNRADLQAILVHYGNEAALGLDGLAKLSYGENFDEKKVTDLQSGFLAQVWVTKDGYYIDKAGQKIGKVGEPVDLDKVVFQTMPTTKLKGLDDKNKEYNLHRNDQAAEAAIAQQQYIGLRKTIFPDKSASPIYSDFDVSNGIGIELENGKQRNNVTETLLPADEKTAEKLIATQKGLITISKDGRVQFKGQSVKIPKGRPVFKYGDTLVPLNNGKLTPARVDAIFEIFKKVSDNMKTFSKVAPELEFLQNVVFYKRGDKDRKDNQVSIDEKTMTLYIGKNSFDISDVANNEKEIKEKLSNLYTNINSVSLEKNFNNKFREFYIKNGELTSNVWDNYQTYLLSSKYPDGSARPDSDIPLKTSIAKRTADAPSNFKQRYSTIIPTNLPFKVEAPIKKVVEAPNEKQQNKNELVKQANGAIKQFVDKEIAADKSAPVSKYTYNNETPNTYNIPGFGEVDFVVDKDGNVSFDDTDARFLAARDAIVNKLEALANKPKAEPAPEVKTPEAPKNELDPNKFKGTAPKDDYKLIGVDTDQSQISEAEITLLKRWHAENVPNIPYEILENIITTHDGEKAFGVFQDGVAKFYKGATKGTEYHELFHGIFNGFLSEEQRQALKEEFKQKIGSFTDRATGKSIKYSDATDKQFEERLADDFGEFRKGKMAAKSISQRVLDFFKNIIEWFKSFGTKRSLVEQLFKDIDTGKFKKAKLSESVKDLEPLYSPVEGITPKQTHEFVQDMTLRARNFLFNENKESIYNPAKMTSNELFRQIEAAYIIEGKRERLSDKAWVDLVQKTKESLRTSLGLKFNEEGIADLNAEDANTREYDRDPFSMGRNDASPAIKIGLMLPMVSNKATLGKLPERQMSSIDGYKILPYVQSFSTIMDKLSNTSDVDLIVKKLGELAKNDPNYVRVFKDIGGDPNGFTFSQDNLSTPADWRYFVDFYQTFSKMRPNVVAQYTNGNEVYLGAANLYTAAKGVQKGWLQNMRDLAKQPGSLIKFDSETKTYGTDPEVFKNTPIGNDIAKLNFLNQLGVNVTPEMFAKFSDKDQEEVAIQASLIHEYLKEKKDLVSLTDGTLDVKGRFATIAEVVVKSTNPLQDGIYTGVDGKTRQANSQNNALSLFANRFNESNTLTELKQNRPELNDVFCTHSLTLQKGGQFFDKDGVKIPGKELQVGLISGDLDEVKDKGRGVTKLSLGKRLAAEINQNVNGSFYVLNPGDSASEWQKNLGINVPFKDVQGGIESDIHNIFKGYLLDDVALALDYKNRQKLANVGKKAKELRFFKDVLSDKEGNANDQLEAINNMIIANKSYDEISKYITDNISKINTSIIKYLDNSANILKNALIKNDQIKLAPTKKEGSDEVFYTFKGLTNKFAEEAGINKLMLSEQDVNDLVKFIDTNKTIANIEFHKILFGDPYQFKVKVENGKTIFDQTKRVKSFDSPAATTFNSDAFNNWHNIEYNKTGLFGQEGRIIIEKGTPGYDEFKDYMSTVTTNDVDVIGRVMGKSTENDASSILIDRAYRQVKLRNADWGPDAEANFQWNMAYTRRALNIRKDVEWTYGDNDALKAHDEALLATPEPKFIREVLKPIVRGNKYGSDRIDLILDKDSQMPLYYKDVEKDNTVLADLYIKMLQEGNKDYIIAKSGRKLGIEGIHELYVDGKFNTAPFADDTIVNVPWSIYGIQVENNYDAKGGKVTSSVQVPKIINLDLFANGKPVTTDVKRAAIIQAEYDRGVRIKNALNQNGYENLLNKLGIDENFNVINRQALADSLNHEILRTAVSENVKDAITLDDNGNFIIPFEATFSYKKIKDIIYSMLDKSINHAKTSGDAYVQAPVTMWEDASKGRRVVEINGKKVLTDDTLHFPTKEDPYMEVMLPHWFGEKIKNNKRFDTDEKVLNYLNTTTEGKEILSGIAFRIPCTGMNSIDSIRVAKFLPQAMGKTVVVPSEITVKAGSDFDVDKLTTYLKNVYIDKNNDLKLVRYQGSEEATRAFFAKNWDDIIEVKKFKKAELLEAAQILSYDLEDPKGLVEKYANILDQFNPETLSQLENDIMTSLEKLGDIDAQAKLKADYINDHYRAALENEYYDHLEKMINLPEVYEQRMTPVDDAGLAKFADEINDLENNKDEDIKNRMINGTYLTEQRHAFAMAKAWIGIVASNIAAHSVAQKGNIILDPTRFDNIDPADLKYLGDGKINIPHNKIEINGVTYATLSGVTTADGSTNISTRLSGHGSAVVDVVKDPFILKIINSNLAPTIAMFLERMGTGETGLLLMKQPIVKDFLTRLDNRGASSLFNQFDIDDAFSRFITTESAIISADTLNIDKLEENIRKYNREGLTSKENAEQHLILNEFLKYAKMSEYMSDINQALTYDTAKFGNGEALSKKQYRTERALSNNIFGGVQELLDNTFLGEQSKFLDKGINAIGEILKLEGRDFRNITNQVLDPYMKNKYLGANDFNTIGNKIKMSFLDYIIQIKSDISDSIKPLIADTQTSIASQLAKAKEEYPDMEILKVLESTPAIREGGPRSVTLKINLRNDAATEDIFTGYMRELRDNVGTNELYNNLVKVAILQGMYKSPISISNIIPVEDFSKSITPIVTGLHVDKELENFTKGWFQRNNFKDKSVFTRIEPKFKVGSWSGPSWDPNSIPTIYYSIQHFPTIETYNIASTDRKILKLNEKYNYQGTKSDYVQFARGLEVTRGGKPTGEIIDVQTGKPISKNQLRLMKEKGDTSFKDLYNYQRVTNADGSPFYVYEDGDKIHVYKLINVYGDGNLVHEYYDSFKPSPFNTGTIQVKEELTDEQVRNALSFKADPGAVSIELAIKDVNKQIVIQEKPIETQPVKEKPIEKAQPTRTILEARQNPIDYTPGQIKALNQVGALIDKNEQGYYLLAGYAGTGKTTIAENIANYAQENGRQVHILAPTNKAAKVLNDKLKATGVRTDAQTIHKAIYGEPDSNTGEWIPKTNLKNSVILVDESSMISKDVMADLITNSKNNNIIVFMGDSFQLEPVGDDSKLFTGGVPQVINSQSQLTEVKRQSLDSNILKVATLVRTDNKGYIPEQSMDDFKVSKSRGEFIKEFREAIKNNENAVAIVATNNERLIMNDAARMEKFGPDRKILNDGETLIAVANSSDIPNSEIFKAVEMRGEPEKHVLTFDFNGKESTYNMYLVHIVGEDGKERKVMHFPALDKPSLYHSQILTAIRNSNPQLFSNLDNDSDIIHTKKGAKLSPAIVISTYGYAVTAHKSQGSQWDKVFVNQNYNAPGWNPARWYYTAITRSAKDLVVLPSASNIRIKNADIESKINSIVPEENDITLQIENETGLNTKDFKC